MIANPLCYCWPWISKLFKRCWRGDFPATHLCFYPDINFNATFPFHSFMTHVGILYITCVVSDIQFRKLMCCLLRNSTQLLCGIIALDISSRFISESRGVLDGDYMGTGWYLEFLRIKLVRILLGILWWCTLSNLESDLNLGECDIRATDWPFLSIMVK